MSEIGAKARGRTPPQPWLRSRFRYNPGDTRITAAPTQVVALPAGRINHHWTKNIRIARPSRPRRAHKAERRPCAVGSSSPPHRIIDGVEFLAQFRAGRHAP
jgi:hypothetical protein